MPRKKATLTGRSLNTERARIETSLLEGGDVQARCRSLNTERARIETLKVFGTASMNTVARSTQSERGLKHSNAMSIALSRSRSLNTE